MNSVRIEDCLDNHEKYVAVMAALPDKELAKKLDLVHIQMEIAEQKKNTASLELLEIWHHQIIEARIYKSENNIPDAPNEIELVIAEIETITEKAEKRLEVFNEATQTPSEEEKEEEKQAPDKPEQLSLF